MKASLLSLLRRTQYCSLVGSVLREYLDEYRVPTPPPQASCYLYRVRVESYGVFLQPKEVWG